MFWMIGVICLSVAFRNETVCRPESTTFGPTSTTQSESEVTSSTSVTATNFTEKHSFSNVRPTKQFSNEENASRTTQIPDRNNHVSVLYEVIKVRKYYKNETEDLRKSVLVNAILNDTTSNRFQLLENEKKPPAANISISLDEVTPASLQGDVSLLKTSTVRNYIYKMNDCADRCQTITNVAASCISADECAKLFGIIQGHCCGGLRVCCTFAHYCGDTSSESLVSFRSPDYPLSTRGSLACDFELLIKKNVCAVQLSFVYVRMYPKLGGVCDIDQILILNSVDGPVGAQCGDLTGYSTTVAVKPGQKAPLKVVIIAQNEGYFIWDILLRQIPCSQLSNFRKPSVCGSKSADHATSFYQLLDLWRNSSWHSETQHSDKVWWREPSLVFNRFYYESTKRALLGNGPPVVQKRIIGGEEAELHEFPWQVAIILKRVFFCGGSLINEEYVLSAAHCFLTRDTPVADLVVFLGDHDLTTSNDTINDVRGVKQIHYHAHFHALLLSNDIALLQLDRPVDFSQRIRPICLPDANTSVLGLGGTVAGWGVTSYPSGKPNAILHKLDVQIMSNEFCESALNEPLGNGNLCAVARGPQQGTCFGDSGGPLTVNKKGKETLIGVVSFGITGCAVVPGLPDLYTRVSAYLQWIDVVAYK